MPACVDCRLSIRDSEGDVPRTVLGYDHVTQEVSGGKERRGYLSVHTLIVIVITFAIFITIMTQIASAVQNRDEDEIPILIAIATGIASFIAIASFIPIVLGMASIILALTLTAAFLIATFTLAIPVVVVSTVAGIIIIPIAVIAWHEEIGALGTGSEQQTRRIKSENLQVRDTARERARITRGSS
jgi:hypothetical protein